MKVKKGKHQFKPYKLRFAWKPKGIAFGVIFDESAMYDLESNDQFDWNKGGGLSFNLFSNHRKSAMFGWRYNIFENSFELTPYIHNGKQIIKGDNLPDSPNAVFSVSPGDPVNVTITFHKDLIFYYFTSSYQRSTVAISVNGWKYRFARRIGGWFGGNRSAPKDLEYKVYQNQIL